MIKQFIEKARSIHGDKYDYSKVDYINSKTKVCIICPIHGEFYQRPDHHLNGRGCSKCANDALKKTQTQFIEDITNVHGGKYDYSEVVYENANTKICITCPKHGKFWQEAETHLQGHGCPKCAVEAQTEEKKCTLDKFIMLAMQKHCNKYDYSKVNYSGSKEKVCIICPEHGEFWQTPENHLRGAGCPMCSHHQSKAESEITSYLAKVLPNGNIIKNNRELLDGKEIDILLPDFHIGIEFNGLHWHSLKMKPDLNYHRDKMLLANHKGYRLIQIFEDEWLEHKEVVLNKLKHIVGGDKDCIVIGARKCTIQQIRNEVADAFLTQYHIQGYVGSTVYLGAYYKDELVGVMSFKEEQPKMWNLTRFATKTDYKLPGLASKMFKYFKVNFEFDEVKSFLDLRWNQSLNGNTVYDKLGFQLEKVTRPEYRYVVGNQRLHKFGFRKDRLHKKYGLSLTMTEREMCNELGFERIYDCGLAKYVYKKDCNNDQTM